MKGRKTYEKEKEAKMVSRSSAQEAVLLPSDPRAASDPHPFYFLEKRRFRHSQRCFAGDERDRRAAHYFQTGQGGV